MKTFRWFILIYLFAADIDECKDKLFCQCKGCSCKNTWGSYECSCGGSNMLYIREHDTCISESSSLKSFWNLWCGYLRICSLDLNTLKVDRQSASNSSNVKLFFGLNAAGKLSTSSIGWGFLWVIFFGLALAGAGAYAVYKYRLRVKQLPSLSVYYPCDLL